MKVTKYTSLYCQRCKRLELDWGDIIALHPEWEYEEVSIIDNPAVIKELTSVGMAVLPILKFDDGKSKTYASISSLSEYKSQIGE